MPWCPKCKNEYKEGVEICPDCDCALQEDEVVKGTPIMFGSQEDMNTLKEFMEYSKIQTAEVHSDETDNTYELCVSEEEENQAKKLLAIYMQQKALESLAVEEEQENEEAVPVGIYQNSAERAEENRSSAYTLILVGGAGLLVMILGIIGIIPFHLSASSKYMVFGVMSALFLLFIVMGFVSMKSSKVFAKKAESENSLKTTMKKWCLENLNAEKLDEEVFGEDSIELTEEAKYFKRVEIIKKRIQMQFMNLDVQFLDYFADDIYGEIFEEN